MELILKEIGQEDLDVLFSLMRKYACSKGVKLIPESTKQQLKNILFSPTPLFHGLLFFEKGYSRGYLIYRFDYCRFFSEKILFLDSLFLEPAFRRNGMGTFLADLIKQIACHENCKLIQWDAADLDSKAEAFCREIGGTAILSKQFSFSLP